ncbi:hypothetical protein ACIBKY_51125 [Nonomuraea sp. NPDC050394]|uniref:hypothetical protein n=1 Tax=Nonomuraea sp. NPDC050394 TaxID=3364363 RepID=UPI0037A58C28
MTGAELAAVCTVRLWDSVTECGAAAVLCAKTGCVHEHIETSVYCQGCAAVLAAGHIICSACFDVGHECEVSLLAEVTETGETVVVRGW